MPRCFFLSPAIITQPCFYIILCSACRERTQWNHSYWNLFWRSPTLTRSRGFPASCGFSRLVEQRVRKWGYLHREHRKLSSLNDKAGVKRLLRLKIARRSCVFSSTYTAPSSPNKLQRNKAHNNNVMPSRLAKLGPLRAAKLLLLTPNSKD